MIRKDLKRGDLIIIRSLRDYDRFNGIDYDVPLVVLSVLFDEYRVHVFYMTRESYGKGVTLFDTFEHIDVLVNVCDVYVD